MDWTPGGMSSDVEDRRSEGGGGGGFGFGGGGGLGIGGIVILLIISLITGRNYLSGMFGGGSQQSAQVQQTQPVQSGGAEDRDAQLISFVLDDTQKTWTKIFDEDGKRYRHAKLVLFRGATYSGCGQAQSATGPFYCPSDEKVYIDLGFWDELRQLGGSTADFAQAYVIAHEIGHHIQKLLGTEARVQQMMHQQPGEKNHLSVEVELQADCFAGVWAHSTEQRGIVHPDDVTEALKAAAAVGDDHL